MNAKLQAMREKLLAQKERRENGPQGSDAPSQLVLHWLLKPEQQIVVRFLEDGNTDNPFFWEEKQTINIPFNGIKGHTNDAVVVTVPCMHMYGEQDPIIKDIEPLWRKNSGDEDLHNLARKYYKKRNYEYQGFMRDMPEGFKDNPTENPIRRWSFNAQIHDNIKQGLMDPDFEHLPTDSVNGLDFRIKCSRQGEYNNYTNSSWARTNTPLSEEELEAIDKYGLFSLKDFLPSRPDNEAQAIIMEMYHASRADEEYDPERFARYYKPRGYYDIGAAPASSYGGSAGVPAAKTTNQAVSKNALPQQEPDQDEPPFDTQTKIKDQETKSTARDPKAILEQIRQRKANKV